MGAFARRVFQKVGSEEGARTPAGLASFGSRDLTNNGVHWWASGMAEGVGLTGCLFECGAGQGRCCTDTVPCGGEVPREEGMLMPSPFSLLLSKRSTRRGGTLEAITKSASVTSESLSFRPIVSGRMDSLKCAPAGQEDGLRHGPAATPARSLQITGRTRKWLQESRPL